MTEKMEIISRMPLLDHGYVLTIGHWGTDEEIIEAARMSTGKGFLGWGPKHEVGCFSENIDTRTNRPSMCTCDVKSGDEKLLRYLWEHKHATPFEMAGMTCEVQAPIFVFREWHRHRTQSYNEMSARYTPLPNVNYVPTMERLLMNAGGTNKQAGTVAGSDALTEINADAWTIRLMGEYQRAQDFYEYGLKIGIPKELARVDLPVGRYSRMRASANLRNWLGFLTLRQDPAAQWEIRQYANAVGEIIRIQFPRTWELFIEGRK